MTDNRKTFRHRISERLLLFIAEDGPIMETRKNRSLARSFRNAVKGLVFTYLSERNFRVEMAAFMLAVALGFLLGIDRLEWAILLLNSFLVLALEAKNTSLELAVNLSIETYHYGVKGAKDAASGAVLLSAISALLVGILIFVPRLILIAQTLLGGRGR